MSAPPPNFPPTSLPAASSRKQRLTVVQILPALNSGGVERGTLEVASELVRRGHRSIVIAAPGRLAKELTQAGSQYVPWPVGKKSPLTFKWIGPLRRLLIGEKADILHARSRVPAWVAYLAWRSLPAKHRPRFITTVHALYSVSAYSGIMMRGEKLIAVSKTVHQYILDNYPRVDPADIELIYRGIDPLEFPYGHHPEPEWIKQWHQEFPQLRHKRPLLTLPARLTRRKGHRDFLKMLAQLHQQGIEAHGVIVGGEDPKRRAYAQQVRQDVIDLNLTNHVTFTGDRSDVRDIYAMSDIVYCLSNPAESFGRTVVEALTIGTPVIGYDLGGVGETLSELLPNGRVPTGDIQALTDRTMRFLDHRPHVLPNTIFTREAMLDHTLALYKDMAAENRNS